MTYYIEETFQKIAKPGYVRVTNSDGNVVNYCSYEDIIFNEAKRNFLARKIEYDGCRLYCACTAKDTASVYIGMNGEFKTEKKGHTEECDFLQGWMMHLIGGKDSISGLMHINGKIPVDFNWIKANKYCIEILKKEFIKPYAGRFSFKTWVAVSNIIALNYRERGLTAGTCDYKSQASDVIFQMGIHPIIYDRTKGKGPIECRLLKEDFYTAKMPDREQRLIYGPIIEMPEKYIDNEDSKFMWVRVYSIHERKNVGFRVSKEMFLNQLNSLPLKENIWISGYVAALMIPKTGTSRKRTGPARAASPAKPKRQREFYRVESMTMGVIFNCNKAGMIVFSKEEYEASNEAIDKGRVLYRTLIRHPGIDAELPLMEYKTNDADSHILAPSQT